MARHRRTPRTGRLRVGRAQQHLSLLSTVAAAAVLLAARSPLGTALDNGVGRTPAMGWSSWNTFRCEINDAVIRQVADAMVSSGLRDAGYRYVNIDDCWMDPKKRDAAGILQPDPAKFADMRALADYVHARGLLFGIYSAAGNVTCEGFPASAGHEATDAATFAAWGVDYLKFDYCDAVDAAGRDKDPGGPRAVYTRMGAALNATGRPMVYSICSWGGGAPHTWGASVGHSWRTGRDLFAVFAVEQETRLGLPSFLQSVMGAVRGQEQFWRAAVPGGFNDPDMLVVGVDGMYPYGIVQQCPPAVPDCTPGEYITRQRWGKVGGLTPDEQRTHFALWCMMASPLLLGNDPRSISAEALEILTAPEMIAINQDALARQGRPVWRGDRGAEVWRKPLADGTDALLLFNAGEAAANVSARWARDVQAPWDDADGPCRDNHDACAGWAASGECERNPGFMRAECQRSCPGACALASPPPGRGAAPLCASVRDARAGVDLGLFEDGITAFDLPPHASQVLVVRFVSGPCTAAAAAGALRRAGTRSGAAPARQPARAVSGDDDGDDGGGRDDAGRLAPWMWAALAVQNVAIVCLVCGRCADNPRWARASRGSSSQRGASIDARKGL